MYVWTHLTAARSAEPSPLLIHLAGEFADRIAALWPAPHAPFLMAGASQRHLIALHLSHGRCEADPRLALDLPIKRALRALLPDAPQGLPRALSRLGEAIWTAADYGMLLALLTRPGPAKRLAHAEAIAPATVQGLYRLPAPLAQSGLAHLALTSHQSAAISEVFAAIERRDGPAAGRRIAERWSRSATLPALLERVREDLVGELPPPPFPGTPTLRPLATKAAVRELARRFDNCLRDQIYRAVDGSSAFYEWTGGPGAAVELSRDPLYGWTLAEAKLRANAIIGEAHRRALIDDLHVMGVRVGRRSWQLEQATWQAQSPTFEFLSHDASVAQLFE